MGKNLQFLQTEFPQLVDSFPIYIRASMSLFMHDKICSANPYRGVLDMEGCGLTSLCGDTARSWVRGRSLATRAIRTRNMQTAADTLNSVHFYLVDTKIHPHTSSYFVSHIHQICSHPSAQRRNFRQECKGLLDARSCLYYMPRWSIFIFRTFHALTQLWSCWLVYYYFS